MKTPELIVNWEEVDPGSCAPIRQIVKTMIDMALHERSSELLFEPREDRYCMALKLGGRYCEFMPDLLEMAEPIINIVRTLFGIDYAVARFRRNQVHVKLETAGGEVDLLVFICRTWHGESARLIFCQNLANPPPSQPEFPEYQEPRYRRVRLMADWANLESNSSEPYRLLDECVFGVLDESEFVRAVQAIAGRPFSEYLVAQIAELT